jgi:hypothetical protein
MADVFHHDRYDGLDRYKTNPERIHRAIEDVRSKIPAQNSGRLPYPRSKKPIKHNAPLRCLPQETAGVMFRNHQSFCSPKTTKPTRLRIGISFHIPHSAIYIRLYPQRVNSALKAEDSELYYTAELEQIQGAEL